MDLQYGIDHGSYVVGDRFDCVVQMDGICAALYVEIGIRVEEIQKFANVDGG